MNIKPLDYIMEIETIPVAEFVTQGQSIFSARCKAIIDRVNRQRYQHYAAILDIDYIEDTDNNRQYFRLLCKSYAIDSGELKETQI